MPLSIRHGSLCVSRANQLLPLVHARALVPSHTDVDVVSSDDRRCSTMEWLHKQLSSELGIDRKTITCAELDRRSFPIRIDALEQRLGL